MKRKTILSVCMFQLVQSLGVVIFQALDYGLSEAEEQKLSTRLEQLIERMTGNESEDEEEEGGDEGIEDDVEAKTPDKAALTLAEVIEVRKVKYIVEFRD